VRFFNLAVFHAFVLHKAVGALRRCASLCRSSKQVSAWAPAGVILHLPFARLIDLHHHYRFVSLQIRNNDSVSATQSKRLLGRRHMFTLQGAGALRWISNARRNADRPVSPCVAEGNKPCGTNIASSSLQRCGSLLPASPAARCQPMPKSAATVGAPAPQPDQAAHQPARPMSVGYTV
jgi:hypothetical protein